MAEVTIDLDRSSTWFELLGMIPAYGVFVLSVVGTGVLWVRRRRVAVGAL